MSKEQTRYSMKEWTPPTYEDEKYRIEQRINELHKEKEPIIDRKRELEMSLSEYSHTIRQGNFSTDQYIEICRQQTEVKKQKYELDNQLLAINRQLQRLIAERDSIHHKIKKQPKDMAEEMALALRDKYMAFSADSTRVSSMRQMSAKFAEEMNALLKQLNPNKYQ